MDATGTKLESDYGLRIPTTRPMSGVSLDEARAYCAWLDRELLDSNPALFFRMRDR